MRLALSTPSGCENQVSVPVSRRTVNGAFDFISKPIELDRLRTLVSNALKLEQPSPAYDAQDTTLIGETPAIADLRAGLEMPTRPEGLVPGDIPGIVKGASAEAGDIYPVPRYLSKDEITRLVENLLPHGD